MRLLIAPIGPLIVLVYVPLFTLAIKQHEEYSDDRQNVNMRIIARVIDNMLPETTQIETDNFPRLDNYLKYLDGKSLAAVIARAPELERSLLKLKNSTLLSVYRKLDEKSRKYLYTTAPRAMKKLTEYLAQVKNPNEEKNGDDNKYNVNVCPDNWPQTGFNTMQFEGNEDQSQKHEKPDSKYLRKKRRKPSDFIEKLPTYCLNECLQSPYGNQQHSWADEEKLKWNHQRSLKRKRPDSQYSQESRQLPFDSTIESEEWCPYESYQCPYEDQEPCWVDEVEPKQYECRPQLLEDSDFHYTIQSPFNFTEQSENQRTYEGRKSPDGNQPESRPDEEKPKWRQGRPQWKEEFDSQQPCKPRQSPFDFTEQSENSYPNEDSQCPYDDEQPYWVDQIEPELYQDSPQWQEGSLPQYPCEPYETDYGLTEQSANRHPYEDDQCSDEEQQPYWEDENEPERQGPATEICTS
ncbi:hypothetical protein Aperf_G00000088861 [Anoplocephala perfoliata]